MAAVAPRRQWRNYLPNTVRAGIRGAIERLPARVQGIFPAPDIRRQIRANPEQRDVLDPEWRTRVGAPEAPADLLARRQYVELESEFANGLFLDEAVVNILDEPEDKEIRKNRRAQLAAALYDSTFEGDGVYDQIYTGINPDERNDRTLINAMRARLQAALEHVDLSPLLPDNLNFGPPGLFRMIDSDRYRRRAEWRGLRATVGWPLPYGIPLALFPLVGQLPEGYVPVAEAVAPLTFINDTTYAALPDLGAVRVPEEDPISFEAFENGEPLLIIRVGEHNFFFKRETLEGWLNSRLQSHEPLTNPSTGLVITQDNLRRGTALVGNAGGQRRARRTRRMKRRSTIRRSGRHGR